MTTALATSLSLSVLREMQRGYRQTGVVPHVPYGTLLQLEREGLLKVTAWGTKNVTRWGNRYYSAGQIKRERVAIGIAFIRWPEEQ